MIEGVEEFGTELHAIALGDRYLFEYRTVEVCAMRTAKSVAASVAVRILARR